MKGIFWLSVLVLVVIAYGEPTQHHCLLRPWLDTSRGC